jgi:uncharacterized membrane protein
MAAFLGNLRNVIIAGVVLAICMIVAFGKLSPLGFSQVFWEAVLRWVHVFFGILWIGLLYYFNFVGARKTPEIPAELRPALSKYITPEALFWFRWAALGTVLAGICVAVLHGRDYAANVFTFGMARPTVGPTGGFVLMSIGIYLAIIMFLNVWGVIWPNQKRALGIVEADADTKAKSARIAGMASRINTLLSLPMLTSMAMYQTLFGGG